MPVMSMGYDPTMSAAALRMANFDSNVAVNILLESGEKVFEFIKKEN